MLYEVSTPLSGTMRPDRAGEFFSCHMIKVSHNGRVKRQ